MTPARVRAARFIAVGADILQMALFPLFAEGFISPVDDVLDVVVFVALTSLVGWHYAFLPSFIVKIVPMIDLAPSWTVAVFLATRQKAEPPPVKVYDVYEVPTTPPLLKDPGDNRDPH
jgi:hypothetical protein